VSSAPGWWRGFGWAVRGLPLVGVSGGDRHAVAVWWGAAESLSESVEQGPGYQLRVGGAVCGRAPRLRLPGHVQPSTLHPSCWPACPRCAAFQLVRVHSRLGCVDAGRMWSSELAPGWWHSQQIPLSRLITQAFALVTRLPFQCGRGMWSSSS
jgi:hypothetical protein